MWAVCDRNAMRRLRFGGRRVYLFTSSGSSDAERKNDFIDGSKSHLPATVLSVRFELAFPCGALFGSDLTWWEEKVGGCGCVECAKARPDICDLLR